MGYSIPELGNEIMAGQIGFNKITKLVWAGLLHESKELTIADVEEMLDIKKLAEYANNVGKALNDAFTDEDALKNEERSKAKSGTGNESLKKTTN